LAAVAKLKVVTTSAKLATKAREEKLTELAVLCWQSVAVQWWPHQQQLSLQAAIQ